MRLLTRPDYAILALINSSVVYYCKELTKHVQSYRLQAQDAFQTMCTEEPYHSIWAGDWACIKVHRRKTDLFKFFLTLI